MGSGIRQMRCDGATDVDSHRHNIVHEHRDGSGDHYHRRLDYDQHYNHYHCPYFRFHHNHDNGRKHNDLDGHLFLRKHNRNIDLVSKCSKLHFLTMHTVALTVQPGRTSTSTITSSTSFYAACATNNLLGPEVAGSGSNRYIYAIEPSDDDANLQRTTVSGPYECCVACLTGSVVNNCQFAVSYGTTGCNLQGNDASFCPNGQQAYAGYLEFTSSQIGVFSNGPCGYVTGEAE